MTGGYMQCVAMLFFASWPAAQAATVQTATWQVFNDSACTERLLRAGHSVPFDMCQPGTVYTGSGSKLGSEKMFMQDDLIKSKTYDNFDCSGEPNFVHPGLFEGTKIDAPCKKVSIGYTVYAKIPKVSSEKWAEASVFLDKECRTETGMKTYQSLGSCGSLGFADQSEGSIMHFCIEGYAASADFKSQDCSGEPIEATTWGCLACPCGETSSSSGNYWSGPTRCDGNAGMPADLPNSTMNVLRQQIEDLKKAVSASQRQQAYGWVLLPLIVSASRSWLPSWAMA